MTFSQGFIQISSISHPSSQVTANKHSSHFVDHQGSFSGPKHMERKGPKVPMSRHLILSTQCKVSFLPSLYFDLKVECFQVPLPALEGTVIPRKRGRVIVSNHYLPSLSDNERGKGSIAGQQGGEGGQQNVYGKLQLKVLQDQIYDLSGREKTSAVSHYSWSCADLARKIRTSESCHMSVVLIRPSKMFLIM